MMVLWFILVFLIGLLVGQYIAYKQDEAQMTLVVGELNRLKTEYGRLESENRRLMLKIEVLKNGYISTDKEE